MLFISHASADDPFVAELRKALEDLKIPVWVDSRELRAGSKLTPEIEKAIAEADSFLVVLSPKTVNSPWVRREIELALEVERRRKADGYRVIPLLLPGLTPEALGTWFEEEPVAVTVGAEGLSGARCWASAICVSRTGSCPFSTRKSRTRSSSPRLRPRRSSISKRSGAC